MHENRTFGGNLQPEFFPGVAKLALARAGLASDVHYASSTFENSRRVPRQRPSARIFVENRERAAALGILVLEVGQQLVAATVQVPLFAVTCLNNILSEQGAHS